MCRAPRVGSDDNDCMLLLQLGAYFSSEVETRVMMDETWISASDVAPGLAAGTFYRDDQGFLRAKYPVGIFLGFAV